MTFIGYKQIDPVQTGYTPPQGAREIPVEAPAYFENGELYVSLGVVHYLTKRPNRKSEATLENKSCLAIGFSPGRGSLCFFLNVPDSVIADTKNLNLRPSFVRRHSHTFAGNPWLAMLSLGANNLEIDCSLGGGVLVVCR
jgi:hypothetical protein